METIITAMEAILISVMEMITLVTKMITMATKMITMAMKMITTSTKMITTATAMITSVTETLILDIDGRHILTHMMRNTIYQTPTASSTLLLWMPLDTHTLYRLITTSSIQVMDMTKKMNTGSNPLPTRPQSVTTIIIKATIRYMITHIHLSTRLQDGQ